MSFYTKISTEITERKILISALEEMKKRGEITSFVSNPKTSDIEVDRAGDLVNLTQEEEGHFVLGGDKLVVGPLTNRVKQFYALEAIKEHLPLDFEIATEEESAGEIKLILKG
ncbi:MAG: hypothetical protein KAT46_07605 [Deltaproteobacteria bacterium]|nr:hypothetical protein [Deltaproteobacteria bacterium]